MLYERRAELRGLIEQHLEHAKRSGREELAPREKAMLGELREVDRRIKFQEGEVQRMGNPSFGAGLMSGRDPRALAVNTLPRAGQLAPLGWPDEELRRLQVAAQRGETARIEQRSPGFSTADPLLPAQLYPFPVTAEHESRLLDRLPGVGIEAPSVTFIRHISTTGAATPVSEGSAKPEVVFETDALTADAVKLAAHNGLSWEIISDWPAFQSYCGTELYRQIIDVENAQLLSGSGSGGDMTGFLSTTGILTHDASADTGTNVTVIDSIEKSIAQLRVGSALATANLLVLHPSTWSAIRRLKDTVGRFLFISADSDPTQAQADRIFDVPVLQTTAMTAGDGLLLDTDRMGYVAVRESLSMRIGYSGTDLVDNILRTVAEERLVLCVTRPPAVLSITNLPTS